MRRPPSAGPAGLPATAHLSNAYKGQSSARTTSTGQLQGGRTMSGGGDLLLPPPTALATALLDVPPPYGQRDILDWNTYDYFVNESGLFTDLAIAESNASVGGLFVLNRSELSANASDADDGQGSAARLQDVTALLKTVAMSVVLSLMILITIIGNVFVIAAIILERNLQNVANYLVASLAVADLFVACLVMPLGAVYEISEGWILGPELCDIWTSCDVLCCTASILHLVAIAADRYWTVTNIDYHNLRTPRRVFFMISSVWFFAVIVSLAPQFGWKDPEYLERIEQQKCMVSQDVAYQVFATCCSFYVPLLVILVLYWKIYKIARKRIQRHTQRHRNMVSKLNETDLAEGRKPKRMRITFVSSANANAREETEFSTSNIDSKSHATEVTTVSDENAADEPRTPLSGEISTVSQQVAATTSAFQQHVAAIVLTQAPGLKAPAGKQQPAHSANPHQKLAKRRQQIEAKRERKAAQTLAIITGAFVVCWLPFFVMALTLSVCKGCEINAAVASLFLWLGYLNSTLNPIIYTIFNPEFRRAFQRLLCGKQHFAAPWQRSSKL